MKPALFVVVLAGAPSAPVVSFAQSNAAPSTRAEVVAQLGQLERAGYQPLKNRYPDDIRAAEARLERASGIGADAGAASASGRPAAAAPGGGTAATRGR